MTEPQILVVEDDPISRSFLTEALASLPARVDAVDSIARAEVSAGNCRHDLWLIDAHLPDGDGEQCLRRLRERHSDVPALSVTAEAFVEELDRLSAAGFVAVIQKPVSVASLLSSVQRALGRPTPPTLAESTLKYPDWDDAAALAALGGNAASLATLRTLFFKELPGECRQAREAFVRGDADAVRAVLHRLKASCGFVGASCLRLATQAWSEAPLDPDRRQQFDRVVDDLRATQG
jgi:CheY-like chemotaxis protein